MSRTRTHKIEGKFNNGLIDDIPINVLKKWDRHNGELGYFRHKKNLLKHNIYEKDIVSDLDFVGMQPV